MTSHRAALLGTLTNHRPNMDVVIGTAVLALALTVALWWLVGLAVTVAHEGAHALVSVLFGGKVSAVLVNRDRTGLTSTSQGPLVAILVTMGGYLGPSAFGLLGALLITLGRPVAVLWISLLLLVGMLTVAASWFTRFVVVALGLLMAWAIRSGSDPVVVWTAATWAWILLIGGLVHVFLHNGKGSDHLALRKATWIPVWFWSLLFSSAAVAAIAYAFSWLTGYGDPPLPGRPPAP